MGYEIGGVEVVEVLLMGVVVDGGQVAGGWEVEAEGVAAG